MTEEAIKKKLKEIENTEKEKAAEQVQKINIAFPPIINNL